MGAGELARDGDLSIRQMRDEAGQYRQLLAWRLQPHVRAVWDTDGSEEELSFEGIQRHYGPRTDRDDVTIAAFIELDGKPIGYIQFYPWAAYAKEAREMAIPLEGECWGLDVFVGDPGAISQGYGSRAVDLLCRYLFTQLGVTRGTLG